jgi:hypothetical protein
VVNGHFVSNIDLSLAITGQLYPPLLSKYLLLEQEAVEVLIWVEAEEAEECLGGQCLSSRVLTL